MPFYKYRTDQGNTVTASSSTSFTGLTGNEAQISSTVVVPSIQPLYLYKVSGGVLVSNDDATISSYFTNVLGTPVNGYLSSTGGTVTGSMAVGGSGSFGGSLAVTGSVTEGGTALTSKYQSKSSIYTYTGTTAPASFASKSAFLTFTGTTAPATYQSRSSINTLTGTTLPATYLNKSAFLTFTGTTAPATYLKISNFNTYSGSTNTRITKIENNYVTGATNLGSATGIYASKSGKNIQFKSIQGGKNIGVSGNTNNVVIYENPEVYFIENTTTRSNTTSTLTDATTITQTLQGGVYKITYVNVWSMSSTLSNFIAEYRIDGSNTFSQKHIERLNNTGEFRFTETMKYITLSSGSHTFSIAFARSGGTASIYHTIILIERVL
jgi:hypothetical protein